MDLNIFRSRIWVEYGVMCARMPWEGIGWETWVCSKNSGLEGNESLEFILLVLLRLMVGIRNQ